MDFRADFGEEVIIVDVGAPHGLVHVGHEAYGGTAQDAAGAGGIGINPYLLRDLFTGAHDGAHVLSGDSPEAAGAFQGAHQGAGAEVVDEIVFVQGGFKGHAGFGHIAEKDRNLRAVPQEADPGEVFAPGEELGVDEVHLFVEKEFHGPFGVFPFIDDAGVCQVQEVHAGFDILHHFELSLVVGPAPGTVKVFEPGRGYEQKACARLSLFFDFIHWLLILALSLL